MVELPSLPAGFEFHHLGYATTSIEKDKALFKFLGFREEGDGFEDTVQGVAGCFLTGPGPRIELLENLPGRSTLTPWLEAGIKIYHLAYWVQDSLESALAWATQQRARVTVAPVAAVAFGGCRISFVMFRNGLMIEMIERDRREASAGTHEAVSPNLSRP